MMLQLKRAHKKDSKDKTVAPFPNIVDKTKEERACEFWFVCQKIISLDQHLLPNCNDNDKFVKSMTTLRVSFIH